MGSECEGVGWSIEIRRHYVGLQGSLHSRHPCMSKILFVYFRSKSMGLKQRGLKPKPKYDQFQFSRP